MVCTLYILTDSYFGHAKIMSALADEQDANEWMQEQMVVGREGM